MRATFALLALTASLSIGCGATTSSRNIRTAGVVALIDVASEEGDEAVVTTELVVGGASSNTSLVLEGGDTLSAKRGDDKRTLQAVGGDEYQARFGGGSDEFVVSFEREGDDDAPNTHGSLPAPFEITSEFDAKPLSRAKDTITLKWSPSGESATVVVELDGDCTHHFKKEVGGDPGKFKIRPGDLTAWKSKKNEACNVDVTITRIATGKPDPALDPDTRMVLRRVRKTRLVSGP